MSSARISLALTLALLLSLTGSAQTAKRHSAPASPLAQAQAKLSRHDLASAEALVWQVLNSDPNNAQALLLLGIIRGEQQRFPEAEAVLQRAVQLNPKSANAHLYLGKTLLTENKLPEAAEQYKAAEELAPENIEVRVTLARLQAANGEFSSALTTLNGIPEARFPVEAIPIKVGSLLAVGRQEEATKLADSATNPAVQLALAEVFVTSKAPQEALKLLNAASASGKRPPARFYFVKGKALDALGKDTAAVESFQKAIALDPDSEEFLLGMAEMYSRENKHAQSFEVLQRAYKLNHDSIAVLRPLIVEGVFAGKATEVQEPAEELEKKSDDPQDLFIIADVLIKNTRQDEAIPLLQKYLEKFPNDARAWVGLGLGYEDKKQFPDAQKAFERALQADPKFAEAEYQLGVLTGVSGDTANARQHYERAVQLNPNHLPALTKLGGLYLQSGEFEKARDMLLKAESLYPNDRQTEYALALVYTKLGNREEAKVHMEKFQSKGPIGATEKKQAQ